MENSFQTSFIPKKPITSSNNLSGKEPVNFFYIITTFLFILSILASGGLFGYKLYLEKQREGLSSSLLATRDSFEKETINELNSFYKKTESAKEVLGSHVALSPVFKLIGDITIPQVQYLRFEEQINEKGVLTVNISGIAKDYRSIALQSDVFSSPKGIAFNNVLFSNLIKDKNDNVNFNLKFNIDQKVFSYEKSISSEKNETLQDIMPNKTQ
jgi:hypothetical protein